MLDIKENYCLDSLNAFKLHSTCDYFTLLKTIDDYLEIMEFANKKKLPLITIGAGCNLILSKKINAVLVKWENTDIKITEKTDKFTYVEADAGVIFDDFLVFCLENNIYGLENLVYIPGTIGASCVQNIGAYGVQVSDFIDFVEVIVDGKLEKIFKNDCKFSYRNSIFKSFMRESNYTILKVGFKLLNYENPKVEYKDLENYLITNNLAKTSKNIYEAIKIIRTNKLPNYKKYPNVGSFFINPYVSKELLDEILKKYPDIKYMLDVDRYKVLSASIIENLGFKGKMNNTGSVGISPQHSLVMINYFEKDADVLLAFASMIMAEVRAKLSIELQIEPVILK